MANRERRISDKAARIIEQRGGLGAPNMVLRDADSKEVLYDNRDATAMAKFNLARGGSQSDSSDMTYRAKFVIEFSDKNFMEVWTCPHCKSASLQYISLIYKGWVHPADDTNTAIIRCTNCWKSSPPLQYKDEEHQKDCEIKYPWIEKFVNINYAFTDEKYKLLEQYMDERGMNNG